mmetsp:Transcript_9438/g.14150  ORF Transcript_9438/g.14150 Transcript_9438/m.14150 type:complete len:374 (+) Transcript_9438:61-1182(+)
MAEINGTLHEKIKSFSNGSSTIVKGEYENSNGSLKKSVVSKAIGFVVQKPAEKEFVEFKGNEADGLGNKKDALQIKDSKESLKADRMIRWIYRLGRDPSLYTKANQDARNNLRIIRQEIVKVEGSSHDAANDQVHAESNGDNSKDSSSQFEKHISETATSSRAQDPRKPRRRRRKAKPRATSPSHFPRKVHLEETYGPKYMIRLPERVVADRTLRAIGALYFRSDSSGAAEVTTQGDDTGVVRPYNTLEELVCPIRKTRTIESWCARDIALFEELIYELGKDFGKISRRIPGKSTSQVVEFYYNAWKFSRNWHSWRCRSLSSGDRDRLNHEYKQSKVAAKRAYERDLNRTGSSKKVDSMGIAANKPKRRKRRR